MKNAHLLTAADLDDPEQFVQVGFVPYIETHDDAQNGKVDERILRLMLVNNKNRAKKGLWCAIIQGHTKLPLGPRDHMPPENEQPEVLGYVRDWKIAPDPVNGLPCLWGDERHMVRHSHIARELPWRSIERLSPAPDKENPKSTDHYADRVSLLRTPPRREFPPIHYGGDPSDMVRFAYGRVAPATEPATANNDPQVEEENDDMGFDHTNPAHVEKLAELLGPHIGRHVRDHVRSALQEMVEGPGSEEEAPKAVAQAPAEEEGEAPQAAPVASAKEEVDEDEPNVLPPDDDEEGEDVDGDGVDDEDEERDAYGELEQPTDEDFDDEYEGDPDDVGEDVDEEEQAPRKQRAKYAEAELGGDNGIVPTLGDQPKKRKNMIPRKQYQKDMGAVATTIEDLYSQIGQLAHERNRLLYQKKLSSLKDEGFELDVEEEASELPIDSPEEFMQKRESHIRKNYRRTIVNQSPVPVAEKTPAREQMTESQMIRVRGYATANRVSFNEAVKALGFNV